MSFYIESGRQQKPAFVEFDELDESLCDAAQSTLSLDSEPMILVWNNVRVPIGYKYDFSFMLEDVVDLIVEGLSVEEGSKVINWPCNNFASSWYINWHSGRIAVTAEWRTVALGMELPLAASGPIELSLLEFMLQWLTPLAYVSCALHQAGYVHIKLSKFRILDEVILQLKALVRDT
jgi:hypothetical protein